MSMCIVQLQTAPTKKNLHPPLLHLPHPTYILHALLHTSCSATNNNRHTVTHRRGPDQIFHFAIVSSQRHRPQNIHHILFLLLTLLRPLPFRFLLFPFLLLVLLSFFSLFEGRGHSLQCTDAETIDVFVRHVPQIADHHGAPGGAPTVKKQRGNIEEGNLFYGSHLITCLITPRIRLTCMYLHCLFLYRTKGRRTESDKERKKEKV